MIDPLGISVIILSACTGGAFLILSVVAAAILWKMS